MATRTQSLAAAVQPATEWLLLLSPPSSRRLRLVTEKGSFGCSLQVPIAAAKKPAWPHLQKVAHTKKWWEHQALGHASTAAAVQQDKAVEKQ
jgi:hypothetical protein